MEIKTLFTRKKIAAFGIGFFGMCWAGGAVTLLLYKAVYRIAFATWPDSRLGECLGRDISFWAQSVGDLAGVRSLTAGLLETDLLYFVLAVPFVLLLACLTAYGWERFAREAGRFSIISVSGNQNRRQGEHDMQRYGGGQPSGPFIHPTRKRPNNEHRTESGKQAA